MNNTRHLVAWMQKLLALLIAGLSLWVIIGVMPKLQAAVNYLPVELVVDKLASQSQFSDQQFEKWIKTTQKSIALDSTAHYWNGLALLFYYRAQAQADPVVKRALLEGAKHNLEQALAISPANAYGWFRLAILDLLLEKPFTQAVSALLMSIKTGPHEQAFLIQRLSLCLVTAHAFKTDEFDWIRQQVIAAWQASPTQLLNILIANPMYMGIIRPLLKEQSPSELAAIENRLEKSYRKAH